MLLQLMKNYNALIKRFNKAEQYFMDANIPDKDKEANIKHFFKIAYELEALIKHIKNEGYEITREEVTEGFRQVEYLKL